MLPRYDVIFITDKRIQCIENFYWVKRNLVLAMLRKTVDICERGKNNMVLLSIYFHTVWNIACVCLTTKWSNLSLWIIYLLLILWILCSGCTKFLHPKFCNIFLVKMYSVWPNIYSEGVSTRLRQYSVTLCWFVCRREHIFQVMFCELWDCIR